MRTLCAATNALANGRENFSLGAELNWHVLAVVAGLSLLAGVLFSAAKTNGFRTALELSEPPPEVE